MYSQTYYLLRSKYDGRHLAARPSEAPQSFLLLFPMDYEALSYLSTHATEVRDRFTVETISAYQIKSLLDRWGFAGVGLVRDPIPPVVEFMARDRLP
jgi:hypothetical protein